MDLTRLDQTNPDEMDQARPDLTRPDATSSDQMDQTREDQTKVLDDVTPLSSFFSLTDEEIADLGVGILPKADVSKLPEAGVVPQSDPP